MKATEHFQRLHMIERHAHKEAQDARIAIEQMADTHSNLAMVLDAFIAEAEAMSWSGDELAHAKFVEHLQAASAELDKAYAPKEQQA